MLTVAQYSLFQEAPDHPALSEPLEIFFRFERLTAEVEG